jgi:hypothetical protein
MRSSCVRVALALGLVCAAVEGAAADDWWMLKNTEQGRECGPPIEGDAVVLTPGEILNCFAECKLMDETPSLELNNVMVNCGGNLDRVLIFSKTQRGLLGARERLTLPAWIPHGRMCRSGASPE